MAVQIKDDAGYWHYSGMPPERAAELAVEHPGYYRVVPGDIPDTSGPSPDPGLIAQVKAAFLDDYPGAQLLSSAVSDNVTMPKSGGNSVNSIMGSNNNWDTAAGLLDSLGTGTGSGGGGDTLNSLWESDPEQAYLNQLGIGAIGLTPYQKWQKAQFNPTFASYLAQSALEPTYTNPWDYLTSVGITGARKAASGLLNLLGSRTPSEQRAFWAPVNEGGVGAFGQYLVQSALGQRYGQPIAEIMSQRYSPLKQYFEGNEGYSNEGASFLDYLKTRYGL